VTHRVLRAAVLGAALLLAGCGSELSVDSYPTEPGTAVNCKGLLADVPAKVAGQDDRLVEDRNAAAWGDPAIIMRCGVEKPDDLGPSSRCDMVDDIGWFTETTSDGYLFTTIGRDFNVSVEVPSDYDPEADALVDLADAIGRHDPVKKACV
jgi:outer membrane murein-binding lipoprotein Lpp